MKKYIKISLVVSTLFAQSCVHFAKPELDHSSQIAEYQEPEKGVNALDFNKGVIDDFSGELYSWWSGDGITLSKKSDTFKIAINNVGSMYVPFGREITSLDFSNNNAIRVRMRVEGKISPTVRIDLKDNLGRTTNSSAVQTKVAVGRDYKDFYFNYKDKWKQGWPDNQIVDPTLVSSVMIFVNPGMSDWTGTLYIDEIVAVDANAMPKVVGSVGGVIDNFDEDPSSSWWTGSSKIAMEKVADKDICKITSEGAGANYETFGRMIDMLDFTQAPVVRIRARVENAEGFDNPKLRVDIKDKDGRTANAFDMRNTIEAGAEFKDYFFDFTGKYEQNWPDKQIVNPKEIEAMVLFINAGGPAYNGVVYIEEIEVITLEKYKQLKK
ncbi:MAG: hypothetical protein NT150_01565 [Bacteroidetes bacterium]|nr:hypothetical protein [Bacteroidota bacterium]